MNISRRFPKIKIIPPGPLLAAAATAWLAVAAVLPARADAVPGEEGKTRSHILTEKSIRHAKESLPRQIDTEIKVQGDGTTVKSVSVTGAVSEVTFTALPGKTYIVSKSESFSERPLTVKGGRFLTLNTVIRVNQIEAARNMNEGSDEAAVHTPETVAAFRDAVSKGFPGAKVTWAFSWLALQDQRTNYTAIRKQVVGYHEKYGDEITFIPGGFFAPMYSTRAQVNQDIKEALQKIRDMVGDGYKPKSIVAGFLAAENMRYLAEEEGIHVCQGTIWSQYGIDNGDGDGSVSYPYYPSREHGCKPAQGKADFIDCVNLDGWTCDFLCARRFGFEGGFNSRLGVGPIESYRNLGVEKGMAEVMAATANHFDDGFTRNGFGWVANCWEISLVKNLKPEVLDCLTKWLQNVRQRWPDTRIVTQGEFGEAWRREHPDNKGLDYRFVQRGTGIGGSETNLEIRWFMNTDFRLAILRDWQTNDPGKVIDFTRYDLPAREPADPSAANPSRNWSLINRINQKNRRTEDTPVPLKDLTKEEQSLIKKRYPALFKCVAEASGAAQARPQVLSGASLIMKQQRSVNMFKKMIMALVPCALCGGVLAAGEMENIFLNPPDSARPGVYWYFMNGNLNGKEMTADLESMKAAGLGNLVFLEVDIDEPPGGPVAFMSPKWQELFVQSVRDAERLGIDITLGIGPGWCGSGGPWVKPEQAMQHLVFSSVELKGPQSYAAILPMPQQRSTEWHTMASPYYEDVALWAFPSRKPLIADIDEKALFYRGPYTLRKQVKPYLPTSARYAEPGPVDVIQPNEIVDLTKQLKPDGTLNWNVPAGDWTIVRMGRRPTGAGSRPAPSTALGLECDKFDAKALEDHLGQFVGVLLEKIHPRAKEHGLTTLHMDSWESGAQNWTPSLLDEFKKRRGYDARPWLPVFTGRAIQSLEKSERFLWDLRLTGQELVLENHAGAVKKYGQKHGLSLSIEPYDMDPAGDLDLGAVADVPMAEFWNNSLESAYSCFEASSIGHVMGKPIVSAESFTSVEALDAYPWSLKNQGDWAFCVGINRFVFHTYAHQALGDAYKPGMTMGPYGVHWHRNQTWWPMVSAYHRYLTRCSELLRQGVTVSDVLYLTPEGTPHIFLPPPSALEGSGPLADKKGYGFDGCSPKILMARAEVKDGRVAFPGGSSYRLMVLPQVETMTPGLLAKIRDLVKAGATIVGPPPVKSPSLSGYPACDGEVQALAKDLWGSVDAPKSATKRSYGKGVIYWGGEPSDLPPLYPPYDLTAALLQGMGVKEDFTATGPVRYGHRRTGDRNIYFVSNRTGAPIQADCRFRVGQGSPQLWDPVTGEQRPLPQFERADGLTVISMEFDAFQSFFVVFGGKDEKPVSKMGKNFADLKTAQELSGAWEVAFDPKWGGPEKITFGALQDWTTRPEPGIKYYSGIATYRKTLNLAQVPKGKTYLDLGVVHDMARVRLNGQDLGVVWCAPWRVEVTGAIKAGDNLLEIEVVNRWANRLIGDKQPADADVRTVDCPPGFLGGKKFKAGRYTFSTHDPYNQQSPLVSSGLLGPVTLQTEPGPN